MGCFAFLLGLAIECQCEFTKTYSVWNAPPRLHSWQILDLKLFSQIVTVGISLKISSWNLHNTLHTWTSFHSFSGNISLLLKLLVYSNTHTHMHTHIKKAIFFTMRKIFRSREMLQKIKLLIFYTTQEMGRNFKNIIFI